MFDVSFLKGPETSAEQIYKAEILLSLITYTVFYFTDKTCIVNNRFCKITSIDVYAFRAI